MKWPTINRAGCWVTGEFLCFPLPVEYGTVHTTRSEICLKPDGNYWAAPAYRPSLNLATMQIQPCKLWVHHKQGMRTLLHTLTLQHRQDCLFSRHQPIADCTYLTVLYMVITIAGRLREHSLRGAALRKTPLHTAQAMKPCCTASLREAKCSIGMV